MSVDANLAAAQDALTIEDVFLAESQLVVARRVNTHSVLNFSVQMRHGIEPEMLFQTRQDEAGTPVLIMRRFVRTGVRLLEPDSQTDQSKEDRKLAEIEAVFAADYIVKSGEQPSDEMIAAFEPNVVFHVWPYWREYLQNSFSRMRLPPVILPMFKRQIQERK